MRHRKILHYVHITILTLFVGLGLNLNVMPALAQDGQTPTYKGVDQSIRDFLCAPSETANSNALNICINRLYRFGITIGGIMLVFFVVLAGYFYIFGGESSKTKGKEIFQNSLTGIIILLLSYTLLRFINPNLTMFRPIQPGIFSAQMPGCEDLGFEKDCLIATAGVAQGTYGGSGNGSIVEVALREVGTSEPGNENRGPSIDKYFKGCSAGPGNYWCACFATWVYRQAGYDATMRKMSSTSGTLAIKAWAQKNNGQQMPDGKLIFISPTDVLSNNQPILPGDMIFWERGTTNDAAGHTFIAIGYEPSTKKIASVEGNVTGDSVRKLSKTITAKDFLGAMRIVK